MQQSTMRLCQVRSGLSRGSNEHLAQLCHTVQTIVERPLRNQAVNNICFAHDIAQAVDNLVNGLRMHFAQVGMHENPHCHSQWVIT